MRRRDGDSSSKKPRRQHPQAATAAARAAATATAAAAASARQLRTQECDEEPWSCTAACGCSYRMPHPGGHLMSTAMAFPVRRSLTALSTPSHRPVPKVSEKAHPPNAESDGTVPPRSVWGGPKVPPKKPAPQAPRRWATPLPPHPMEGVMRMMRSLVSVLSPAPSSWGTSLQSGSKRL